jgi:uroporphyrinogen III methyltransferase / synthase
MTGCRPLEGRRVVVTRPRAQAKKLVGLLLEAGAEPVFLPTIRIEPVTPDAEGEEALRSVAEHDGVIFTSANAVHRLLDELSRLGLDTSALAAPRLVAVGSATARALSARGVEPDLVPERFSVEAVVEALGEAGIRGRRFLYPCARVTRPTLHEAVPALGGTLVEVVLYETVGARPGDAPIPKELSDGSIDAVTFMSPSAVHGFFAALGAEQAREVLAAAAAVAIGPTTEAALREEGVAEPAVAAKATVEALVEVVAQQAASIGAVSRA